VAEARGSKGHDATLPSDSDPVPFTWGSEPREWPDVPAEGSTTFDGPRRTDRLAVWSLVCSLAGFLTGLTAVLGIVFGLAARHRIARSQGSKTGRGLALSGILVGVAALAWTVVAVEVAIRAADDASINLAWSEVLPSSTYPSGWMGQGPYLENDGANFFSPDLTQQDARQVAACLHMRPAPIQTDPVEAASQPYGPPNSSLTAQDTVDVFSSTAAASYDAIASGNPDGPHCLMLNPDSFRYAGDYLKGVTSRQRTIPRLGDHDSDIEVRTLDSHDSGDVFYDDYVTIQQGTSESNLLVSTLGPPPTAALIDQLARAAAWRLTHR
jgi:hypothetical protein